ncbi:MAG: lysylphosphatidylglycerol synthase transmembrane domain-containing protein [Bacteroidota bacterium]|nr:lysylphosphatidylglycerol synthase transmembrane domain-containing protein [Bacteroidota bacterium]
MKHKVLTTLRILFFLGIGGFFIWLFLHNLTPGQKTDILFSLKIANYWWIIVAIVLGVISHLSRTLRWKMLLEPIGYTPKTHNVFFAVFIGYLANLALPRLGEVSRCGVLTRYEKIPFTKSFGTVITERAIDMVLFVILFFLNIFVQRALLYGYIEQHVYEPLAAKFNPSINFEGSITKLFLIFIILALAFIFIFRRAIFHSKLYQKLISFIKGFWLGIVSVTKLKNPLLFLFHSLFIWCMYLLMAWVVFLSLPGTVDLGLDAGLSVLMFGTIGIIIVQGGIGIYPAIVAETLLVYDIPKTTGYATGWLIWSAQTIMMIIAGTVSMVLLPIFNKEKM